MKKMYYFAVYRPGDENGKKSYALFYGKNAYKSPEKALAANIKWIANHLGEKFTVMCFDKQPVFSKNGLFAGYEEGA